MKTSEILNKKESVLAYIQSDALLRFVLADLKKRGLDENTAMTSVFNSYVLEEKSMYDDFKKFEKERVQ